MSISTNLFPTEYDRTYVLRHEKEFKEQSYDSSNEPLIPRGFWWEPNFDFATADNDLLLKNLIINHYSFKARGDISLNQIRQVFRELIEFGADLDQKNQRGENIEAQNKQFWIRAVRIVKF